MRVLLISANRETINMVTLPLGLASVAAAVREQGHEVYFLDLLSSNAVASSVQQAIRDFDPEVIGVSVRNIDDQNSLQPIFLLDQAKEVVDLCRAHSTAPIILGGAGYSIYPLSALDYLQADYGIQGEGESAFPELLTRIQTRKEPNGVPGLFVPGRGLVGQRRFISDLGSLPRPDLSPWSGPDRKRSEIWLPLQTRRGCPLKCVYCSTPTIEGTRIRKSSPIRVARYMADQVTAGFENYFFADNIFNLPPSFVKGLCQALIEMGVRAKWRVILYPGNVDAELVGLMAKAGCTEVSMGMETGSAAMLTNLNKKYTLDDVRRARLLLADFGIKCMGFLLLGGPGETRASVMKSLEFADSLPWDGLKLTIGPRIYPETPLAAIARANGYINPETNLLFPTFYIEPDLKDWLFSTIRQWAADRPYALAPMGLGSSPR